MSSVRDTVDLDAGDGEAELHLFFVTGNPGLISYYDEFLHSLQHEVNGQSCPMPGEQAGNKDRNRIGIYGTSLRGFELEQDSPDRRESGLKDHILPFSLQQQITYVEQKLRQFAGRNSSAGKAKVKIALAGHSVGAYIVLEILRRRNERRKETGMTDVLDEHAELVAGILLFPTIVDIAKSPSGRRATRLLNIPGYAKAAGKSVHLLMALFPLAWLVWLVGKITGMPQHPAHATARFLKSKMGVTQALCMGRDEMNEIKEDRFGDEIWGLNQSSPNQTRLFLLFGRNDHWVAEQTRDAIVATRGSTTHVKSSSLPLIEVDETGLPHGFCLRHSEQVAKIVARYVDEVIPRDSS